jgi:hypothetical protein
LALLGRIYKLGSGLLATDANALKPRISWDNGESVQRTLLWESAGDASGIPTLRQYVDSGGHAQLTTNARFDGVNWNKDINGQEAFSFTISKFGISHTYQIAGTNTWVDVSWLNVLDLTSAGLDALGPFLSDLILAANKDVKVQGTGKYKHGTRTARYGPGSIAQISSANGWQWTTVEYFNLLNAFGAGIDITLEAGKRITEMRLRVRPTSTNTMKFSFVRADWNGVSAVVGTSNISNATGTRETILLSGLNETILSEHNYSFIITRNSGTFAQDSCIGAEVDYDEL